MNNRRLRLLSLLVIAALAVGGACSDDEGDQEGGGDEGADSTNTSLVVPPGGNTEVTTSPGVTLGASLTGAEEVPGPGIDNGVGTAELRVGENQVCYVLKVTMGEKPTAAHIHEGLKGASGGVVVNFEPTFAAGESAFTAEKCVEPSDSAVLARIASDPSAFYVNVHTAEHPNGAVRGQLAKQ